MSYLYAIRTLEAGYVKIGHSVRPNSRLVEIAVGCPYNVELYAIKKVKNAPAEEKFLHSLLSKYRMRGEWFRWNETIEELLSNWEILRFHSRFDKFGIDNWLVRVLSGGPIPAMDVRRMAEEIGVSLKTLQRSKKRMGVRSLVGTGPVEGRIWRWSLPEGVSYAP